MTDPRDRATRKLDEAAGRNYSAAGRQAYRIPGPFARFWRRWVIEWFFGWK